MTTTTTTTTTNKETPVNARTDHPTALLVQGAWHHPDAWLALRGELFLRGWRTIVTDLPSAGTTPIGSMHDDADTIRAAIASVPGPVTVIAHSYGGIPATEATASASDVDRLIYLAAYLPDDGESMMTLHDVPDPDDVSGPAGLMPEPRTALYGDLPDDAADAALDRLLQQTLRSFADRTRGAGWRTIPTTYIVCDRDQAIPPTMQKQMAERAGVSMAHLDSGHSPFLSRPSELADLLTTILSDQDDQQPAR
jgi:pimeloyl-ACP methyl ester carboxylesterase